MSKRLVFSLLFSSLISSIFINKVLAAEPVLIQTQPAIISLASLDQNLYTQLTVKVKEAEAKVQTGQEKAISAVVIKPKASGYVLATAYSSTVDQTDGSPCITSSGLDVCRQQSAGASTGVAAANWLKFGTKVRLPDYFGQKIFIVEDRMHPRFSDRLDIWFPNRSEAIKFGARMVKYEVVN